MLASRLILFIYIFLILSTVVIISFVEFNSKSRMFSSDSFKLEISTPSKKDMVYEQIDKITLSESLFGGDLFSDVKAHTDETELEFEVVTDENTRDKQQLLSSEEYTRKETEFELKTGDIQRKQTLLSLEEKGRKDFDENNSEFEFKTRDNQFKEESLLSEERGRKSYGVKETEFESRTDDTRRREESQSSEKHVNKHSEMSEQSTRDSYENPSTETTTAVSTTITTISALTKKIERPVRRTVVFQVSVGRSGSSFLGGSFNVHEDVFYMFEPLAFLKKRIAKTKNSAPIGIDTTTLVNFLKDIVTCNFQNREGFVKTYKQFFKWSRSFKDLNSSDPLLTNSTYINNVCLRHKFMVLKVLSLRLSDKGILAFQELFSSLKHSMDFKIIHLVRDPRAVLASWRRLRWSAANRPKYICDTVISNINTGKNLPTWLEGKYKLVLYEDFCLKPFVVSQELYRFIGIRFNNVTETWLRNMTQPKETGAKVSSYSTSRNSTAMVNKWKKLPKPFLKSIQNACGNVLKTLNYELLSF